MANFTASGGNITVSQVAQDAAGDTFVIGSLNGTATIDGATISSTAGTGGSGFVAKINADGSVGWTQVLGGATGDPAYSDQGYSIAVSADGQNVYVGAGFTGTFNLPGGGTMVAPNANTYGALLDLNGATGTTNWHMQIGANVGGSRSVSSIALDGNGNVYATGGMYDINPQTLAAQADNIIDGTGATISTLTSNTSAAGQGLYILKASATTGAVAWATPVNTVAGDINGSAVAVDGSGHVYMVGQAYSVQFGANGGQTAHTSGNSYGAFIGSIDASTGTFGTVELLSANNISVGGNTVATPVNITAVTVDASGNPIVAGSFGEGAKLVPGSSTAQTGLRTSLVSGNYVYSESRVFVEKFDTSLSSQWLATEGGSAGSTLANDSATGIVVTGGNAVAVVGNLTGNGGGTSQFGSTSINSPGSKTEGFAWALNNSNGSTLAAGGFSSAQSTSAAAIAKDGGTGFIVGLNASTTTNVNPLGSPTSANPGAPGFITTDSTSPLCFFPGTRIATPNGEAAVEELRAGDLVVTTSGEFKPVNWLGRQTVSLRFAQPSRVLPIRIRAGALADNVPSRDLLVSPDHALLVGDVLIQAGALINGTSITREADVPPTFVYYHVELDDHSLILAENTPAETFIDNVERLRFDNWDEFEALYPNGKVINEMPYPRAKAARQVPERIRTTLIGRSQAIGAGATQAA